jgi:dTDP-3-amino-3,4,6-trideoxy-alpha-D-glucose transaminase
MKFFDLGLDDPDLRAELDQAYRRVMDSGWMILGRELEAFEAEFSAYCGASHTVGVGNGYDALVLALRAAGIEPGSEVIVPAHTFAATWLAVMAIGARPVPVEVNPASYTLEADAVSAAVTSRTRAVIPVSLYGHPVDMEPLMALAGRHGLFVLEDAAQSQGAAYRGRRTGALAHATAFSFYPTKNLGALGDAGAVVTSDPGLAERVRRLRNYGSSQKYRHEVVGVNSRLDEMQAGFLRVFLKRLDASNDHRRDLAATYGRALAGIQAVTTPDQPDWARHVYHLYVVRAARRDDLQARLRTADIETLIHYPTPCHLQPAFETLGFRKGDFPLAERLAEEVLSLPMWPRMAAEDIEQVVQAIRQASSPANI